MAIHITANGKICADESTGNIKIHSGDCCEDCSVCLGGSDNSPTAFKVTLGGNANLGTPVCSSCTSFDGNHTVPYFRACNYRKSLTDHCSTGVTPFVGVFLSKPALNYLIDVTVEYGEPGFPTGILTYRHDFGTSAPDCTAINLSLTYAGNMSVNFMNVCDPSNITMGVLAL